MAIYIFTSTPIATTIIESETTIPIIVEDTPNAPTIHKNLSITLWAHLSFLQPILHLNF